MKAEFNQTPDIVIVHNPIEFGNFKFIKGNEKNLQNFLFREIPKIELFKNQHDKFIEKLIALKLNVKYITDILSKKTINKFKDFFNNNPNFVYTRDAMITLPWVNGGYFLCNMGTDIRNCEPTIMDLIAKEIGLKKIINIPPDLIIEGGDVIPFTYDNKKVLLIGYGRRTTYSTLEFLRNTLVNKGIVDEIIGLNLAKWRINLDGCCVPTSNNLIVLQKDSILSATKLAKNNTENIDIVELFKSNNYKIIEVDIPSSIYKQACNIFCSGKNEIIAYDMSEQTNIELDKYHNVSKIVGSELVKGTGGPRCMTRPIYL